MTDRFGIGMDAGLEAALVDLGSALEWPETPDLAPAVVAAARASDRPRPSAPRPTPTWIRRPRTVRRALLLAAALALVIAGAAAAIRLGLDLLEIRVGPVPSAPIITPSPRAGIPQSPFASVAPGARLGLGRRATLDEAASAAGFAVSAPGALGGPAQVFVGGPELHGQIAFLYEAGPDLPASDLLDGAGLLVTQARGRPDAGLARKLVDAGLASMDAMVVGDAPGYWIHGQPHLFWYLAPDGSAIEESRRLVGDTLVWEHDGILYRIEGAIDRDRAIEIAGSMTALETPPAASGSSAGSSSSSP